MLHELDPQTYLADVLEKIVSGQTRVNSLRELLPWAWKKARVARRSGWERATIRMESTTSLEDKIVAVD